MSTRVQLLSLSSLHEALPAADRIGAGDWRGGWIETRAAATQMCPPVTTPWANEAEQRFFTSGAAADAARPYPIVAGRLAWLERARLAGRYVVVSLRNEVIRESYSSDAVLHQDGRFLRRQIQLDLDQRRTELPFVLERDPGSSRSFDGAAVLIAQHWHFNYHHWLIECLPRLREALERPELCDAQLLVPEPLSAFQRESLDLLGVDPARLLGFDGSGLQLRRLWWPTQGCFAAEEIHWLRRRCLAAAGVEDAAPRRRLYISRSDAASRRLLNEAELRPLLDRAGFEQVTLTGMPFVEQVRLFAQAAVILGPHGAGLSNQIFAPAAATVAELMPDTAPNLCFYLLTCILGQRYAGAVGRSLNPGGDFTLAPARLEALLASLPPCG